MDSQEQNLQHQLLIPVKKLKLGMVEIENPSMYFYNDDVFGFAFMNGSQDVFLNLKVGSDVSRVEQVYEKGKNFISWKPKPKWGHLCSLTVPEGFPARIGWQKSTFKIEFPDCLDEVFQGILSNAFSTATPIIATEEQDTVTSPSSDPVLVLSDDDCDKVNSSVWGQSRLRHISRKQKVLNRREIFDDDSSGDSSSRLEAINEKSSVIKERQSYGGCLDVSIHHLFKEDSVTLGHPKTKSNTEEASSAPQRKLVNFDDTQELLTYPPGSDKVLRIEDYKCLDENEMLSGGIIDFYMQYIHLEMMPEELRNRVHFCSSPFYNLYALNTRFSGWRSAEYTELSPFEKRYLRVKGLNEDVDIFEKDYVVIPCLDKGHWFLAIACFIKLTGPVTMERNIPVQNSDIKRVAQAQPVKLPCILLFNSLKNGGGQATEAIIHIRNFIASEYKAKHDGDFPFSKVAVVGCHVPCPEQSNAVDCGLFMFEFIEHFFFKSPITDFRLPIDLSEWFDPKIVAKKRGEVANALRKLIIEAKGELPELPEISCVFNPEYDPVVEQCEVFKTDTDRLNKSESKEDNPNEHSDPLQTYTDEILDIRSSVESEYQPEEKPKDSSNKSALHLALVGLHGKLLKPMTEIITDTLAQSFSGLLNRLPAPSHNVSLSSQSDSSQDLLKDALEDQDEKDEKFRSSNVSQIGDENEITLIDSD